MIRGSLVSFFSAAAVMRHLAFFPGSFLRRPRMSLIIPDVVNCLSFSNPGIITIAVVKRMVTAQRIAHW